MGRPAERRVSQGLNMNEATLKQLIIDNHNPALAKESMVYQVWENGEITAQKGGSLLWQRTLHLHEFALNISISVAWMPERFQSHGYAFTTKEGALAIRQGIKDFAKEQ